MNIFSLWTISHMISHLAAVKCCGCPEILAYVRCEFGSFYLEHQCHQHHCYSAPGCLLSAPEDFVVTPCSWRWHDFCSSLITMDPASSHHKRCLSQTSGGCNFWKYNGWWCRSELGILQPLPHGIIQGVHRTPRRLDHFPSGIPTGHAGETQSVHS